MAIPLTSDLAFMFSTDDFALDVTYRRKLALGQTTIQAIFDNETIPIDAGGFVQVHQEQPRLTCKTSDLSNISEDDVMIVSSVEYRVVGWIHDGTGVTEVQLEKV
jgi:hypothetical protein